MFEVVIYNFASPSWATGHQYCIIAFICHILAVCSVQISSPVRIPAPVCQGFCSHLSPPTHPYIFIYMRTTLQHLSIQVHPPSLCPPSLCSGVHPLTSSSPTHLLFSPSFLLCVFCFGAVIFRLISEVMHFLQIKEEANLPPPLPTYT